MGGKKRVLLLVLILTVVVLTATGITNLLLFRHEIDSQRQRLVVTVQSHARLMESIARFNAQYNRGYPGGAIMATMSQIINAHERYSGFGETGEFSLAQRKGNLIEFLFHTSHHNRKIPEPVPVTSEFAEPMRQALRGQSGSLIGLDYRGDTVLAAYEPVAVLNLGLVAKIDLSEIRAPFIRTALLSGSISIMAILAGALLIFLVTNPMIKRIQKNEELMNKAQTITKVGSWQRSIHSDLVIWSDEMFRIYGLEPGPDHIVNFDFAMSLVHPADLPALRDNIDLAIKTGRIEPLEYRLLFPDGSLKHVRREFDFEFDKKGIPAVMIGTIQDITGRKKSQEALEQSEEMFRAITTSAQDAIVMIDHNDRITFWNESSERIFGYTSEEMEGKEFHRLVVPGRNYQAFSRGFENFQNTGRGAVVGNILEVEGIRKGGVEFPLELSISAVKNADNWSAVGIVRDISERKRTEEERVRLATAVEQASESIVITDAEGTIQYVNPAFERVTGYCSDAAIGQNPRMLKSGKQNEEFYRNLWGTISKGETWNGFLINKTRDGSLFEEEASISPIRDPAGTIVNFIAVKRNITEQRRAEIALRESEKRYRHLFEGSIQGILVHRKMKPLFANRAFAEMFGYESSDEVVQVDDISSIISPEDRQRVRNINNARTRGEDVPDRYDFKGVRKDGTSIWVETIVTSVDWQEEAVSMVAFNEITKRKQLEEQLRQSQKMEAIGQLAGGVAHDFNNILAIILSYSELLRDQFHEGDPVDDDLQVIQSAAKRAALLTRQLLAFSRRQPMKLEILDLNEIIGNMEKMLRRLIGENIGLTTIPADGLGQIEADAGQLEQILMNLAVNARDAMPQGGMLTVETANATLDEEFAKTHIGSQPGNFVMLAVSDIGTGMDQKTRSQVFDPFFTTKEQGKGTGLGLSTVYGIVKQFKGSIWVYSEPGQGTTFKVYLPWAEGSDSQAEGNPSKPENLDGKETILLVEDEEMVRRGTRRLLEKHGHTVLEASQGVEAMDLCRKNWDRIQLMLTDVIMPLMSGKELAKEVEAICPQIRILYMSGYTDEAIARQGVLEGGITLLQKPFSEESLLRKVREVLEAANEQG